MEGNMIFRAALALLLASIAAFPVVHSWGKDGHRLTCMIAEERLSASAGKAIEEILPGGDFPSHCTWPDEVRRTYKYRWSGPLHYIDTPDDSCSYDYQRDCHSTSGEQGMCLSGAIQNFTSELQPSIQLQSSESYNLTEALLFLVHFMGDIHQPLHVGFTTDAGGNSIHLRWYRRKSNLHHVWDADIITTAMKKYYSSDIAVMARVIGRNFTKAAAKKWTNCGKNELPCPDRYATESIEAACNWAYKDAEEDSVLEDAYFESRLPIVQQRLAQGGVRLAALLNKIFE